VYICTFFVENKWANIDVIYYEYGALVLVYNNSERATRSFNILQDAMFDSKPLLVLLLPNIQVGALVTVLCLSFHVAVICVCIWSELSDCDCEDCY